MPIKTSLIALALCFLFLTNGSILGQELSWANTLGGSTNWPMHADEGAGIGTDAAGNTYVTGIFTGVVDIDPGAGIIPLTSQNSSADIYVQKFDPAGNLLWHLWVGGTGEDHSSSLTVDSQGNILITGHFEDGLDFSNVGVNTDPYANSFLWKISPSGSTVWLKSFAGGNEVNLDMTVEGPGGKVYLSGSLYGSADMDPGPGTASHSVSSISPILIQLDSAGNYQWSRVFNSTCAAYSKISDILVTSDASGVYIGGQFVGSLDANPGTGATNLVAYGNEDFFVAKLRHSGQFEWAHSFGKLYSDVLSGLETGPGGKLVLCGSVGGIVDFDPSPTGQALVSDPDYDIAAFVLVLDSLGNFNRLGTLQSNYSQYINALEVDDEGNMFIEVDLGQGEFLDIEQGNGIMYIGEGGEYSTYLIEYGPDFGIRRVLEFKGGGILTSYDIHQSSDGSLLMTGSFLNQIDLEPGDSSRVVIASGYRDAFALRLECTEARICSTYFVCDSLSLMGQTFTTPGLYYLHIPSASGCDTVLTANISMTAPQIWASFGYFLQTALVANAQYQWLNCDSGMAAYPGQNSHQFFPPHNGNFAVAVTVGNCTDTSACFNVSYLAVEPRINPDDVRVAQMADGITVFYEKPFQVSVLDPNGHVLYSDKGAGSIHFDLTRVPSGIYLIRLNSGEQAASKKFAWMPNY